MSEVTELTNEQELRKRARKWLMDNFDLRWKWAGDHTLSNEDRACMELAAFAQAELLRRLSTQGAGPRCPECQSENVNLDMRWKFIRGSKCHDCKHEDYPSAFFRAPSDPPRPEYTEQQRQDWIEHGIVPVPNSPTGKLIDALIRCLWLLESPGVYQIEHVISLAKAALKANGRDPHEHGSEEKR